MLMLDILYLLFDCLKRSSVIRRERLIHDLKYRLNTTMQSNGRFILSLALEMTL
jgi:hypothetical protein